LKRGQTPLPRTTCGLRIAAARSDPGERRSGFTPDGREYVITTTAGSLTPAPWANVLANPRFLQRRLGERSRLYLGRERQQFRLTHLAQRPGIRRGRKAFYLRDEESGLFWVADAAAQAWRDALRQPARLRYSVVRAYGGRAIHSELWVYVAVDAPVKFSRLLVAQPVWPAAPAVRDGLRRMGAGRPSAKIRHARGPPKPILTAARSTRAIRTAPSFPTASPSSTWTMQTGPHLRRAEFIGRNGSLQNPAGDGARLTCPEGGLRAGSLRCDPGWVRSGRTGRSARSSSGSAWPGTSAAMTPTGWCIAFRGADRARRALSRRLRTTGTTPLAQVRVETTPTSPLKRADQRLLPVPDPGVPPVGAQRVYYPVGRAPSASATSCRSAMALVHAQPQPPARPPAPLRGGPVP